MSDLRTWDAWCDTHQPFELDWWKRALERGHSSDDAAFARIWDEVRAFVQPHGRIIDIGCGPRPPFAPCVVIEPLSFEYQKITPPEWWDKITIHAVPAEQLIPELSADTIICWNCIDHAIGWREILDNMLVYGGSDATYAIATDFHEPFVGHPGFTREEFYPEIMRRFEVLDKREPFGRDLALRMRSR